MNFNIRFIVGVNVSRSANIISHASVKIGVPYILVIAGTDANIAFPNPTILHSLKLSLSNSLCIMSLSHNMTSITLSALQQLGLNKNIYTIVQSSILPEPASIPKVGRPYIIFPTSFRKVKAVDHALKQLNRIIEEHDMEVILAGPILDQ